MIEFYATLTGHRPMFHGKQFGAVSFDAANHRIALLQVSPWEELAPERAAVSVGLHHVGYEYGTLDERRGRRRAVTHPRRRPPKQEQPRWPALSRT
jgi:hypothetical protein